MAATAFAPSRGGADTGAGPLPPVRLARVPLVSPHGDPARARGPAAGDRRSPTSRRSATSAAGPSAASASVDGPGGREYTDALHGWSLMSEAYFLTDPGFRGRITVPGAVGHAERADRQQRVERHHPHVRPRGLARRARARGRARPLSAAAARGDRRDQRTRLRDGQQRRLPRRLRPPPGGLRARVRGAVRQLRVAGGPARVAALSARRALDRGRLAAVPDARALRRGLQRALPLQLPTARRLPQPVALRARALPAAGRRGDGRDGADQAPLLHHARRAQPQAHHPCRPGL